jgi:glycosyltransferase involved in cell wall biosynthesis
MFTSGLARIILTKPIGQYLELAVLPFFYFFRYTLAGQSKPDTTLLETLEREVSDEIHNSRRFLSSEGFERGIEQREFLIVCRGLFELQKNGVGRLLWIQACVLKNLGYKVRIYCEWKHEVNVEISGIAICGMPANRTSTDLVKPAFNASWSKKIQQKVHSLPINVEIISTIAGVEALDLAISERSRKHYIFLITDHLIHNRSSKNSHRVKKLVEAEKLLLSLKNVIPIGDSNAIIQDLAEALDLPSLTVNCKRMYPAIPIPNAEEFYKGDLSRISSFQSRYSCIIFVGRIGKRKNLRLLLEAWQELVIQEVVKSKNLGLIILGSEADDLESLGMLKEIAGAYSNVLWLKNFSDTEKFSAMSRSLMTVISSDYESFGYVALESLKVGTVVIAPDTGGLSEVIGSGGWVYKVNEKEALVRAILTELKSPKTHIEIETQAELFSISSLAIATTKVFELK